MRQFKKIFVYVLTINIIFLATLLSDTNKEDELDIGNKKENSQSILELEELETKTTLSMDKEIVFPRDI